MLSSCCRCFVSREQQFEQISLSRQTIARRIEELGNSIEASLASKAEDCTSYSLALDESTDIKDTAQLAIFVRAVDESFCVIEELAAMVPLKGSTKGTDLLEAVMTTLNRLKFNFEKHFMCNNRWSPINVRKSTRISQVTAK